MKEVFHFCSCFRILFPICYSLPMKHAVTHPSEERRRDTTPSVFHNISHLEHPINISRDVQITPPRIYEIPRSSSIFTPPIFLPSYPAIMPIPNPTNPVTRERAAQSSLNPTLSLHRKINEREPHPFPFPSKSPQILRRLFDGLSPSFSFSLSPSKSPSI